jgi:hypothetical protein
MRKDGKGSPVYNGHYFYIKRKRRMQRMMSYMAGLRLHGIWSFQLKCGRR